ncbi:MAG: D-xylose transport system ATP-binding protein [Halanaerobiales bacterium]|nr:D-xylose transport system ATP-binding protein [Halanaerobiales bacterium]
MINKDAVIMKNVTKEFPGVVALDQVSLNIKRAEVRALVGENGAGKSTLIKVLSGYYPHSSFSGELYIKGEKVKFNTPGDAEQAGIAVIHQEMSLLNQLSIAENLFVGRWINKRGIVNWKKIYQKSEEILNKLDLNLDPGILVKNLGVGQKQLIEIGKALLLENDILILDEPTAALTERETEKLFKIIKNLKEDGVTIIYISHRLEELFEIADTVTVLRDGKYIGTKDVNETTEKDISTMMVGRDIKDMYPKINVKRRDPVLKVKNYSVFDHGRKGYLVENVSFTAYRGEILCFTGLIGSGRSELFKSIFGALGNDREGRVFIDGQEVNFKSPYNAIKVGMAYLTEERKNDGLILPQDVKTNISLAVLKKISKRGILNLKDEKKMAEDYVKKLDIRIPELQTKVEKLSGGNQQKVVLAKWLASGPKILVLDEPTRGIDVGARVEIYNIINHLIKQGVVIIIISSDMQEVLGISDRIIVMREGKINGEFERGDATEEKIITCAIGVN